MSAPGDGLGRGPAPILGDAMNLYAWLHGRFGDDPRRLPGALCERALGLCDDLTLALAGRDRPLRLESADERLVCLRMELRLAAACGLLTDAQVVHAFGFAERIGRQLGGWIRAAEGVA